MIFADDWGRHPSSAQYLANEWRARYRIDWVNTIGSRRPRWTLGDARRALGKLNRWTTRERSAGPELTVYDPWMWPTSRTRIARASNARALREQLRPVLFGPPEPLAVITTHPMAADLAGITPHLNWMYYCVDAFDHWPGLDHATLRAMEDKLIALGCPIVAASEHLAARFRGRAREAIVVTHGVRIEDWCVPAPHDPKPPGARATALYFGGIDRRLDSQVCTALAERMELVLVGPLHEPDPRILRHSGIRIRSPVPVSDLPALAASADVLVMPYADLPATRAMQPLKLKEYLATGKPVVATSLPAVLAWSDALDVAADAIGFANAAERRAGRPLEPDQLRARGRLAAESWGSKALEFERRMHAPRQVNVMNVRICVGAGSGPESLILPSARFLRDTRYQEAAAYLHNDGDPGVERLRSEADRQGCSLHPISERFPFDLAPLRELKSLCRSRRIRIWHGHDYKSNLFGLILSRSLGVRLVTTVHGWVHHTWKTPLYHAIDRWCLRRYERVIVVSKELLDQCVAFGVPRERLRLVENSVDTEAYKPIAASPFERPACEREPTLVVGTIGRLEAEKGLDVLIAGIERLAQSGLDLDVRIAGEGLERERLQSQIAAADARSRIQLLGRVADAAAFLSELDIVVLPSRREGCPLALLEAMAMGKPIVASRVGGIPDVITDGVHALLVDPDDPVALGERLRELASSPELRSSLGAAARRRVVERYSSARRARDLADIYDELELA